VTQTKSTYNFLEEQTLHPEHLVTPQKAAARFTGSQVQMFTGQDDHTTVTIHPPYINIYHLYLDCSVWFTIKEKWFKMPVLIISDFQY
jgi:hypothetical protein